MYKCNKAQTITLLAKFSLRSVLLKRASQKIKVHVSTDLSVFFPFSTYKAILGSGDYSVMRKNSRKYPKIEREKNKKSVCFTGFQSD